jgi:hypothetical protein
MLQSITHARAVKAEVMRVVGNNGRYRFDSRD